MKTETMANNMEEWMDMVSSFAEENGGYIEKQPGHWYSALVLPKTFKDPVKAINDLFQDNGITMVKALFIGYINDPSVHSDMKTVFFKLMPTD